MRPPIFSNCLSYRLGSTPYTIESDTLCPHCGAPELPSGFHAAQCKHFACSRHNAIAKCVASLGSSCGLLIQIEAPLRSTASSRSINNNALRPGDVLAIDDNPPSRTNYDINVSNPAAPSYAPTSCHRALHAATISANKKTAHYSKPLQAHNATAPIPDSYVPLCVETYGAWSPQALLAFRKLARRRFLCPDAAIQSTGAILRKFLISLDVCLQRANAIAIAMRGIPSY